MKRDKVELINSTSFNNEKLTNKYNAIARFLNSTSKDIAIENGCLNDLVIGIEYKREHKKNQFYTEDYITIKTERRNYYIENEKQIFIDRKYKTLVYRDLPFME